jgi:hypothetical protein
MKRRESITIPSSSANIILYMAILPFLRNRNGNYNTGSFIFTETDNFKNILSPVYYRYGIGANGVDSLPAGSSKYTDDSYGKWTDVEGNISSTKVERADTYNGGFSPFSNCSSLKSISLPNGVQVGGLMSVVLSANLSSLEALEVRGEGDVTFKAKWSETPAPTPTEKTKVRIVWIDRNDEDKIRPESITVQYKKNGSEEAQEIVFPIEDAWDTTIEGTVSEVTSVSDGGIRIKPTDEHPHGQDKEGEYAYSIINNKLTGCIIVLYHTAGDSPEPGEDVLVTGSIAWDDNNDAAGKRPEKVVVHLMKDDEYTGIQNEVSSATKWEWFFNLSSLGDYDPGASYSVTQEPVPNYSTKIAGRAATGFIITNSLIAEGHKHNLSEVKSKPAT